MNKNAKKIPPTNSHSIVVDITFTTGANKKSALNSAFALDENINEPLKYSCNKIGNSKRIKEESNPLYLKLTYPAKQKIT